jgi:hypothetical protein
VTVFGDQAGSLEHRYMFLYRREAHRVVSGQLGDPLVSIDGSADDVASGGVCQSAEHFIKVSIGPH